MVAALKAKLAEATGADAKNIWVIASHTFSAPHMFGNRPGSDEHIARYRDVVESAVTEAASLAASRLQPALLGYGTGRSDVNVNRNVEMADGWWLGANDAGASDKTVATVSIEGADKQTIAILANYAVQSAVMNQTGGAGGGKGVTADLGGAAVRAVEQAYGGNTVALFLTGAAGDQVPDYTAQRNLYDRQGHFRMIDMGADGYSLADLQGERLGTEIVRIASAISPSKPASVLSVGAGAISLDAQERPRNLQQIKPTRSYTYPVSGKADAPFSILRIGDVALVGVQVELNAATGAEIKRRSPFRNTFVVTMVNGAAKYMPDAEGYRHFTYQAMNSSYGPGSAELLTGSIVAELRRMKTAKTRPGE